MTRPTNQPPRLHESTPRDSLLARGLTAARERGPSDEQAAAVERQLFYALGAAAAVGSVGSTIGAGAASAPTATGAALSGSVSALALKVALVLAVAAGGGVTARRVLRHHDGEMATRHAIASPHPPSDVSAEVPVTVLAAALPADDSVRRAEPVRHVTRTALLAPVPKHQDRATPDPLHSELRLIETARATASSDPARAIRLCLAHERDFPKGVMREEREAIFISSLISLGRDAEARSRQAAFVRAYPSSPYAAQLRERLRSSGTP